MYKLYVIVFFLVSSTGYSQIKATLNGSVPLNVKQLVSVRGLEDITYLDFQNAYHKILEGNDLNYSNIQLGSLTSINAFNTLKINLFYQDLNTIIILDNRLAEIYKIDLNTLEPYRNITHITTGYDNTLWVFNADLQRLELYDYKSNKIKVATIPVDSQLLDLKSDYNYVWLLTDSYLYKYNYQGSLVSKISNDSYTSIYNNNENLLLSDGEKLYYLDENSTQAKTVEMPDLLIKQFLLAGETLYIYDGKILYQFQLKI